MALVTCPECGKSVSDTAKMCPSCGYPLKRKSDLHEETDFFTNHQSTSNSMYTNEKTNQTYFGLIGFILALIGLFLPVPFLDVIVGIVALTLSIIGKTNQRDSNPGLAVAGIVISIIGIVIGFGWAASGAF